MMKIAILGGGNMGGAILFGAINSNIATAESMAVSYASDFLIERIKSENLDVKLVNCNAEAIGDADIVILAVKPWLAKEVLTEISECINPEKQIVASIVAGLSIDEIIGFFIDNAKTAPALMRIIPNTAISIGKGMTFMCERGVTAEYRAKIYTLFDAMGRAMYVKEEEMAAYTALASCGIAFAFKYMDAAIEGAEQMGIEKEIAREVVAQTIQGAVSLIETNGTYPVDEIAKVTTPGGITLKGLAAMEKDGFASSVVAGLKAAR